LLRVAVKACWGLATMPGLHLLMSETLTQERQVAGGAIALPAYTASLPAPTWLCGPM
jgi:hypothetical protein